MNMNSLPIWVPGAIGLLLVVTAGFAFFDHHKLSTTLEEERAQFASSTAATELTLTKEVAARTAAEAENARLRESLDSEARKNRSFAGQINDIASTVGTLSKLAETDPQLLAKYSKVYFLNENYAPAKLSDIDSTYAFQKGRTYEFHTEALPFLTDMLEAAAKDGVNLKVASSYRSFGSQAALKSSYAMRFGTTAANSFSADQGYSEHQLGTALDLTTDAVGGTFVGFDKSEAYKWLSAHAYEYGFILSYPSGNTYYVYEPWHWRFVGTKLARDLHESGKHFYDLDQRELNTYLISLFD